MRDEWHADDRDIVKWGSAIYLARRANSKTIVQVAFHRRTDGHWELTFNDKAQPIPPEVFAHFRDLNHIQGLEASSDLRIVPIMREWTASRDQYVAQVIEDIKAYDAPRVVLLDPDTGIEPAHAELEHVKCREIERIHKALEAGDVLAVYQHRWRVPHWLDIAKGKLAEAIHESEDRILVISCFDLAHDVAILAVTIGVSS